MHYSTYAVRTCWRIFASTSRRTYGTIRTETALGQSVGHMNCDDRRWSWLVGQPQNRFVSYHVVLETPAAKLHYAHVASYIANTQNVVRPGRRPPQHFSVVVTLYFGLILRSHMQVSAHWALHKLTLPHALMVSLPTYCLPHCAVTYLWPNGILVFHS